MSASAGPALRIQSVRHVRKLRAFAYNWLDSCDIDQGELEDRFAAIDSDGDGTLDKAELQYLMEQIGEELTPRVTIPKRHTDALFEIADEDGDGTISKEEFPLVVFCLTLPSCIECGWIFGNPEPLPGEECLKCTECPQGMATASACYCKRCFESRVGSEGAMVCGHSGTHAAPCSDFLDNLKTLIDQPEAPEKSKASESLDGAWARCECCNKPHLKMDGYHAKEHVQLMADGRWFCEFCAGRVCSNCAQWTWTSDPSECELMGCRKSGGRRHKTCTGALNCKPSLTALCAAVQKPTRPVHCESCQLFVPIWAKDIHKNRQKEKMDAIYKTVQAYTGSLTARCTIA